MILNSVPSLVNWTPPNDATVPPQPRYVHTDDLRVSLARIFIVRKWMLVLNHAALKRL